MSNSGIESDAVGEGYHHEELEQRAERRVAQAGAYGGAAPPTTSYSAETRFTKVNIKNAQNVVHQGTLNVTVLKDGSTKKKKRKALKPLTTSLEQPSRDQIMDIKDRVGPDWKDLGRRLDFDDALLDQMELDFKPLSELIYQILNKWKQNQPENATRKRLAEVFMKMDRGDLADFLAD